MRSLVIGTALLLMLSSQACSDIYDPSKATIVVFAHSGEMPIEKKKVELRQTGAIKFTDKRGLAEFNVSPGSYTVRVYDVSRGGPTRLFVDFNIDVKAYESKMLDVAECLPCD